MRPAMSWIACRARVSRPQNHIAEHGAHTHTHLLDGIADETPVLGRRPIVIDDTRAGQHAADENDTEQTHDRHATHSRPR